jgi:hypothetical protein
MKTLKSESFLSVKEPNNNTKYNIAKMSSVNVTNKASFHKMYVKSKQ